MKFFRKIGFSIVIVSFILGNKFYTKSQTASQVKQSMISTCNQESECLAAVNNYFDDCFNSSYDLGSRRRSADLDANNLANCINAKAGSNYFVYEP